MVGVPGPRVTLRLVTVLSGLRIQTKSPSGPVRTAVTGTTTTFFSVCSDDAHIDELAGEQRPWAFGKRALAFTVPVVGSTWLSRVEKTPWSSTTVLVRS